MLLNLKPGIVYGPVNSRRLGRSLGINVLPRGAKLCTFDCAYCQYGWTDRAPLAKVSGGDFPTVDEVAGAVERALRALSPPPAYLTFSGNGEPTLHPRFGELVEAVTALRARSSPQARTAILSNSAGVSDPALRAALSRLDARIMKLDAGNESTLRRFNRPLLDVSVAGIAAGLRSLGGVTIQSLFAAGPGGNAAPDDVTAWVDTVAGIRPAAVQVYTLARGCPSRAIRPLAPGELEKIAGQLTAREVTASCF